MSAFYQPAASRTTTDREAAERFAQSRVFVAGLWPFLVGAVMRLCPRWTSEVESIAVDAQWRLYMNPAWVRRQHPAMLALIITGHELQHVLGGHHARLSEYRDVWISVGGSTTTVANAAHDLAINSGLKAYVDAGNRYQEVTGRDPRIPLALPTEAYYPELFRDKRGRPFPNGRVSEEYAELLLSESNDAVQCPPPSDPSPSGAGGGQSDPGPPDSRPKSKQPSKPACGRCGSGANGARAPFEDATPADLSDPGSGVDPVERETIKQQVAQKIREQSSRMRGTVPGHMEQWAELYLTPSKVPWDRELRRHARGALNRLLGQHDYSYSVPNKRNQNSRVIFPGLYKPDPKFILALDSSGSMCADDYAKSFGHVAAILRSVGQKRVPIFTCDAAASEVQYVTDIRQVRMRGGGGTDMRVAISRASELGYRFAIVLSDGETPWPPEREGTDVIAVLTRTPSRMPPSWIRTIIQDED